MSNKSLDASGTSGLVIRKTRMPTWLTAAASTQPLCCFTSHKHHEPAASYLSDSWLGVCYRRCGHASSCCRALYTQLSTARTRLRNGSLEDAGRDFYLAGSYDRDDVPSRSRCVRGWACIVA